MRKQDRKLRKRYHRKRIKAEEQLKQFEAGKLSYEKLNRQAKDLLQKRMKAGYELPAKLFPARKIQKKET